MWDYFVDIVKGVPKDYWGNVFIMQSDENLKKVMQDAKDIERFYMLSRPEAMELALAKNELNENLDFTDSDLLKLRNWVNEV